MVETGPGPNLDVDSPKLDLDCPNPDVDGPNLNLGQRGSSCLEPVTLSQPK